MMGGQNSPELQINSFLARVSETGVVAQKVYKKLAVVHAKFAASSDPTSAGIPMKLTPPRNAKYADASQIGKECTFYLHFTMGCFEHVDNKMMGLLYIQANNVQSLVCGGMFANFTKATLLRPKAKVLPPSDAFAGPSSPRCVEHGARSTTTSSSRPQPCTWC